MAIPNDFKLCRAVQYTTTANLLGFATVGSYIMEMRCFCAQAQKQVDKSEIYLAISSLRYIYGMGSVGDQWGVPTGNYK